jgi:CheY-like chemotaxis protein
MSSSPRSVKLLHVEDNAMHRRMLLTFLKGMSEYSFETSFAESENAALDLFNTGGFNFIILDYQLEEGNGLSCLGKIRKIDPNIPIVALSGTASDEVASELLAVGADDYLSKSDLSKEILEKSISNALSRFDAINRLKKPEVSTTEIEVLVQEVCALFVARCGNELYPAMNRLEAGMRQLTLEQVHRLFLNAYRKIEATQPPDQPKPEKLLRPLLLEMFFRLFNEQSLMPVPPTAPSHN